MMSATDECEGGFKIKNMRKTLLIIAIFGAAFIFHVLNKQKKESKIDKIYTKIERIDDLLIDAKVIVEKDTLTIVDTKWLSTSVILSNKLEISYKYAEKHFLDKHLKTKIDRINGKIK